MNHAFRSLAALAFVSLTWPALATSPENSVVRIRAVASSGEVKWGSGVVIGFERLATACHVTRQATRVEVLRGEQRWIAGSQTGSVIHDLCVLTVEGLDLPSVAVRSSLDVMVGERVTAVGFQHGSPSLTSATGAVRALYRYEDGQVIRTSAEFDFGSSGGGLFDEAGRLVGLLAFKARSGADLRFALPSDWLRQYSTVTARFQSIDPALPALAFWECSSTQRPTFLGAALREASEATR